MEEANKILLKRLRPQIIPIVEGLLHYSDTGLMSAIGNSYGDIYETQLNWAQNSKMNKTEHAIPVGYKELILPILQGKLWWFHPKLIHSKSNKTNKTESNSI